MLVIFLLSVNPLLAHPGAIKFSIPGGLPAPAPRPLHFSISSDEIFFQRSSLPLVVFLPKRLPLLSFQIHEGGCRPLLFRLPYPILRHSYFPEPHRTPRVLVLFFFTPLIPFPRSLTFFFFTSDHFRLKILPSGPIPATVQRRLSSFRLSSSLQPVLTLFPYFPLCPIQRYRSTENPSFFRCPYFFFHEDP